MALVRSEDYGSRFSIGFIDVSPSRTPLFMRVYIVSILGMFSMVSLFVFVRSLMLYVCSMMLCFFMNT